MAVICFHLALEAPLSYFSFLFLDQASVVNSAKVVALTRQVKQAASLTVHAVIDYQAICLNRVISRCPALASDPDRWDSAISQLRGTASQTGFIRPHPRTTDMYG